MTDIQHDIFGGQVEVNKEEDGGEVKLTSKKEFNVFALTDAIVARNKREAWVIYQKAKASGMVPDEIFWRVVWGVKSLLLAAKTNSAQEAGLNPFVYKKMKGALKNWKTEKLEKLSETLVVGYHNARRGIGEIDTLLEKIILNL